MQLKSALLMNDAEFLDKFDVGKPRQDDADLVFYGLTAGESAPAVQIAHELGFKWFAEIVLLSITVSSENKKAVLSQR